MNSISYLTQDRIVDKRYKYTVASDSPLFLQLS